METIFTLQTQMGKPSSNGGSILHSGNLWLHCFHGSLCLLSFPKRTLRVKFMKEIGRPRDRGKANNHDPSLLISQPSLPFIFLIHLIIYFPLCFFFFSLIHVLHCLTIFANLHKLLNCPLEVQILIQINRFISISDHNPTP
jgi:hypothetical protein